MPHAVAPALPRRRRSHRSCCRRGCGHRRRRRRPPTRLLRPSDPADDDGHRVRTGESIALRARALQRGTLVHRLLQSLPDIATERRRDAALGYLARNADGWTDERARSARGRRAGADRRCAVCAGVCARQPRRGLDCRPAGAAGRHAGAGFRPDRPAGGDAGRGSDRRLQDQPRPAARPQPRRPPAYVRQLALYRAVLAKLYPQRAGPRSAALDRNA